MAIRKTGLPKGFTFEVDKPNEDAPVRSGDYLDEMLSPSKITSNVPNSIEPSVPTKQEDISPTEKTIVTKKISMPATPQRTRINITMDRRTRLGKIVDHMAKFGPEPDVRASEVVEALILALYDHREHLDMSNVRRRGRYGSASHKNFPIALAESVAEAMAIGEANKR